MELYPKERWWVIMQKATHDFVLTQKATHDFVLTQKATAVHEVTAERSEHDFVLAQKRIDIFYKLNSEIQKTEAYCAHWSFEEKSVNSNLFIKV
jgi:hypothetical protein